MRTLLLGIPLIFAVQVMTVGAQSQSQTQSQPAAGATAAAPREAITVTGCLQSNPAGSGSSSANAPTGGTTAAGSTPYVLANASANAARSEATGAAAAEATRAASGNTPGAVGTSGTVEVTSYVLHGRPDELGKHVGHRIEIIGMASQAAPSGDSAVGTTSSQPEQQIIPHEPQRGPVSTVASPAPAPGTAHPSVQHLSVQSVRMLAETCK